MNDSDISFIEFTYNNSFYLSIQMIPYEILYERKCRTLICWEEVGDMIFNLDKVQEIIDKIHVIKSKLKAA